MGCGDLWTYRACAITFEKLSLRILIKDVIRRMLVMQTKMSWDQLETSQFGD